MMWKIVVLLAVLVFMWCDKGLAVEKCPELPNCLPVFTHEPSHLPKCYCTNNCERNVTVLYHTCKSGQVHTDPCGHCLTCASARNEVCGGSFNVWGICAGGYSCLIKVPSSTRDKDIEDALWISEGVCVPDYSDECDKSTDTEEESERKKYVNCRPGHFGIPTDALFCRTPRCSTTRNRSSNPSTNANRPEPTTKPPKKAFRPSLLDILGK